MKKLIACIALLTALVTAAETETLTALINKVIAIPAEKLLVGKMVDAVVSAGIEKSTEERPSFQSFYYDTRAACFELPEASEVMWTKQNNDWYWSARALIITKLKKHLHTGTTLCETYKNNYSEAFRTKVSTMTRVEREALKVKLASAYGTFAMMKSAPIQTAFTAFQKAEQQVYRMDSGDVLLSKNLTEEEVGAQISAGEMSKRQVAEDAEQAFILMFTDPHLAKFAGRRYLEGGDQLIDQYLALITTISADAK